MVWLMHPSDIQDVENRFRVLMRSERPDPQFLKTFTWIEFRRRLIHFLNEKDTETVKTGDNLRMTTRIRLVVLGAYPSDACVAEVELFYE
jgi:hypothetical protein